jgi:hypothetical protein
MRLVQLCTNGKNDAARLYPDGIDQTTRGVS